MFGTRRNDESPFRGMRIQSGRRPGLALISLVVLALLIVACGAAAEPTALPTAASTIPPADTPVADKMVIPMVAVADQEIVDGTVTSAEVVSDGPGWLVIHSQADGKPGPILGYSPVADGSNTDVTVEVDATIATGILYAMLHTDAGAVGTGFVTGKGEK